MGHKVAKLRLAAERNLSIAAMWAQGSSDGQKLDSRWKWSEACECLRERSAKGNDVKAWADQGLRGVLKRHWLSPGCRHAGSVARLGLKGGRRSRCGVAWLKVPVVWLASGWAARRLKQGERAKIGTGQFLGGSWRGGFNRLAQCVGEKEEERSSRRQCYI